LMTGTAFLRSHAVTFRPTPDVHFVRMPVVTLTRKVSVRVTVHTARMPQDGNKSCEERSLIAGGSAGRTLWIWSSGSGLFLQRLLNARARVLRRETRPTAPCERVCASASYGLRQTNWQPADPLSSHSNTAFAIAGAAHGTPGSPIPPAFSLFSTIWVSICGDSLIRITGNV